MKYMLCLYSNAKTRTIHSLPNWMPPVINKINSKYQFNKNSVDPLLRSGDWVKFSTNCGCSLAAFAFNKTSVQWRTTEEMKLITKLFNSMTSMPFHSMAIIYIERNIS